MYIKLIIYSICAVNVYRVNAYVSISYLRYPVIRDLYVTCLCYRSRISDVANEARADRFYHTSSAVLRSAYRYGCMRVYIPVTEYGVLLVDM